jgi:hypothetical protein
VERTKHDVADLDLGSVVERLVREGSLGIPVDVDREAVLERETPVAGHMIGVGVRLEDSDQPRVVALSLGEHRLHVIRRIDDDGDPGLLVTHEIRGAAQIVVQELLEQHGRDATTGLRYVSESGSPAALATSSRACSSSRSRITNQPIATRKTRVCSPFIRIPPRFWSRTGESPQSRGACS